MYLSNWQRIKKLFGFGLRHPGYLPRYVRYHPWRGRKPVDIGLPWWSFGAIDFVEARLRPGYRVFEYGTGGSTLFFGHRARSVDCVEDDPAWEKVVRDRLRSTGLANVSIRMAPLAFANEEEVSTSGFLRSLDGRYDVIVVDGQDFGGRGIGRVIRPACFARAEGCINPGGMVVVDDSWRLTELRSHHQAKEVHVFEMPGPCRMGITSTDVYVY